MNFKEIQKQASIIAENYTKTCKCGKRNTFFNINSTFICRGCGRRVFFNDKDEFMYRLKEKVKKA